MSETPFTRTEHLDGKVTLYGGDSRDVLKALPDSSVHSIVTDPPYGLLFMGRAWDAKDGTPFAPEFWAECLRVLKPGGHVVAFSGTRTYHRMAVAIEDAGFEIRDQLAWAYGCLDDQTMAVTPNGVMPYHKINQGDLVLSYSPTYMAYQWERVEEVCIYDVDDTVFRIATDFGDQVVSRNHRCIVECGGAETFQFAEEAARQCEIRVPVLEDLRALLDAIPDAHEGAGRTQSDVLPRVQGYVDSDCGLGVRVEESTCRPCGEVGGDVLGLRDEVLAEHEAFGSCDDSGLLARVQRRESRERVEQVRRDGARELEAGIGDGSDSTHDGPDQSSMERRRHVSQPEGKLCERTLHSLPTGALADGAQGRLRDGASPECGDGDRSASDEIGVRASHRPQSAEQRTHELDAVRNEQRPQIIRAWRGHKAVVGRITPERYRGVIWCVRVKSGAFVAVRNGFAFPTGNSGFPKSHDVSKGIDKAAGAEREVVSSRKAHDIRGGNLMEASQGKGVGAHTIDITAPATEAARKWQGFGTALKPSWEPICLARKPLIGTVAANVLAHGTGALNIDGCRVGTEGGTALGRSADKSQTDSVGGYLNAKAGAPIDAGRWPANIVHDGSEEVLAAFPETTSGTFSGKRNEPKTKGVYGSFALQDERGHVGDSGSAARFFYTAKADRLDRMASKHPTVKPVDLMQWLVRLITPPGGVVLDPFAGSGSTGEAAWREGMQCVLIEREAEYQTDIATRLELANAGPATRRSKAIKQVVSAGPLFGDVANDNGGGQANLRQVR